jgi:glutathione synthase/RimK-type ligase-like ATP-grasp enzyme
MKTIDTPPASEQADKEEVLRVLAEGKRVTDPELRNRIHERAEKVREQVRTQHGLLDVAVDIIREGRDED